MVASVGSGIIAEHLSTVKVWIDQVYFSETWDKASKGVAEKADIEKNHKFSIYFGCLNIYSTNHVRKNLLC